ncbi:MAG TPA: hypothetical protein VFE15_15050 [Marmoricola sp.]|jgi:hypothetical protein|nr:hypothetical protein [Marmoricola sp.]
MRSKLLSLLTVIGAITVLVLAGNTVALAATGHGFLLGKTNSAKTTTTLVRTKPGAALTVKTKSSTNPPFSVNGKGKVTNLNADLLDGKDSTALGTRAYTWSDHGQLDPGSSTSQVFVLNGLPDGTYLINYEIYFPKTMITTGTSDCELYKSDGSAYGALTHTIFDTNASSEGTGLNGSGLMTAKGAGDLRLECFNSQSAIWNLPTDQPLKITAIPISSVTNKGVPPLS